jgi:DNA-binding CsgD family transcriptional regulator
MSTAFVGRAPELERLLSMPSAARKASAAATAVITGPPGSGKTRLLAEAAARLGGLSSARLIGYEPVETVPLAAASDLLRELGVVGERDPLAIFEAAHGARIRRGPIVVLIDDLQWLDALSLSLVHYLLRAAEADRRPLTVIAASRPSSSTTTFLDGLAAILPEDRRAAIALGPLDVEAGISLVRGLDAHVDEDRATAIWRRAQGSPFWLEALTLDEAGAGRQALFAERLAAVGGDAAAVLGTMGVGARPLAVEELAAVLDWPADRVQVAAHELVARGLVATTAAGVRFSHDLIREAALAELPASAARRLHERFAAWIEGQPDADLGQLREALEHRHAAGLPGADLAARILDSPSRRLLGIDGLQAVAAIADRLDPRSAERLRLDSGLAELAAGLGEQQIAIERWSRVAERSPDPSVRRAAELGTATAEYRLGRAAGARSAIERARAVENGPAPDIDIRLDALEALTELWLGHRTASGVASASRAIDGARSLAGRAGGIGGLNDAEIRAYQAALEAASDAATQENRWDDLAALVGEIERLADLLDDDAATVDAITRVGSALRQVDRSVEAEPLLRRAWALARERVLPASAVETGHWLARVLWDRGLLAEARAIGAETAALEARLGHGSRHWSFANRFVHSIDLSLGDPRVALAALRSDAARDSDRHHELGIRQQIAEWQARYGGAGGSIADEIDAQLAIARACSAEVSCPRCGAELEVVDAEIQARLGRIPEAEAKLRAWLDSDAEVIAAGALYRRRAETAIALARGDHEAARAAAEAARAEAVRMGRAIPELWALIDLGRALTGIDRAEAVRAYTVAAEHADAFGAVTEGRLIAHALRGLGVRAWRRKPASQGLPRGADTEREGAALASLSAREREIADRIGQGDTNAEVAAGLSISPKTVERHATNIFAKLGLRNRAELAALVRGASLVRGSPDDRGSPSA